MSVKTSQPAGTSRRSWVPTPIVRSPSVTWTSKRSLRSSATSRSRDRTVQTIRSTFPVQEQEHFVESVKLLQALAGEGEHGPHAVAASADGQSLYVIAGNATRLPNLARSRARPGIAGACDARAPRARAEPARLDCPP